MYQQPKSAYISFRRANTKVSDIPYAVLLFTQFLMNKTTFVEKAKVEVRYNCHMEANKQRKIAFLAFSTAALIVFFIAYKIKYVDYQSHETTQLADLIADNSVLHNTHKVFEEYDIICLVGASGKEIPFIPEIKNCKIFIDSDAIIGIKNATAINQTCHEFNLSALNQIRVNNEFDYVCRHTEIPFEITKKPSTKRRWESIHFSE